jgi:methylmalonyl-CoA/ethylmalonyl-CoA epimerase
VVTHECVPLPAYTVITTWKATTIGRIFKLTHYRATATGIGITRLGQVAINVKDVERAAAFYEEKLGLKLLFKAPPGLAFFECGGVRLMLDRAEKPEFDHPSSVLYFAVPDIQASFAKLKESEVRFEDEPHLIARMPTHDLWMTFFRDSEGNLLALMSEVAR